jgi:hypothetical protein
VKWEISDQIGLMSMDGASNFCVAVDDELQLPWAWCLAHILNLVVNSATGQECVSALISKACNLVKHFKVQP